MSTLMRGLVGLNALPAGTLDGKPVPARLQLAPQLPAGWGRLKIRNLRWQNVTADVSISRNASGLSVEVSPRGGSLPLELHAILPPGSRLLTRDLLWRPVTPGAGAARGLRLVRTETVAAPSSFAVRTTPGIQVAPLHAPLEPGDVSSRLRVIDATLEGSTYTLRVEGRRGRGYQVRLLSPPIVSVQGATRVAASAGGPGRPEAEVLRIEMPPADPAASGAVLKRSDWATATVIVQLGSRQP
jgi:Glycosyl hydrolase family 65, C-terminal domain